MQFRVGLMFLGTVIVTVFVLLLFRGLPEWTNTYPLQIRFDYAPGVTPGTPVRKSGIRIGSVDSVRLADRRFGRAADGPHPVGQEDLPRGRGVPADARLPGRHRDFVRSSASRAGPCPTARGRSKQDH